MEFVLIFPLTGGPVSQSRAGREAGRRSGIDRRPALSLSGGPHADRAGRPPVPSAGGPTDTGRRPAPRGCSTMNDEGRHRRRKGSVRGRSGEVEIAG